VIILLNVINLMFFVTDVSCVFLEVGKIFNSILMRNLKLLLKLFSLDLCPHPSQKRRILTGWNTCKRFSVHTL